MITTMLRPALLALAAIPFPIAAFPFPAYVQDQSRPPVPTTNPGTWFSQSDWPHDLFEKQIESSLVAELSVDPSGEVVGCRIAATSGYVAMDNIVCERFLERAEFDPALDETGVPVAGTYTTTVSYRFEDNLPELPISSDFTMTMVVDESGMVVECEVEGDFPYDPGKQGCPLGFQFKPATGVDGKPVGIRVRTRISVEREAVSR